MKKKGKVLVLSLAAVLCVALAAGRFGPEWYSQPKKVFEQNREALEAVVADYLDTGRLNRTELDGISQVNEWPGKDGTILEFLTDGSGIAPAGRYKGFYYSAAGHPAAFQNSGEQLVPNDEGWWDWQGEGDNAGRTKPIGDGWYVFEAHF